MIMGVRGSVRLAPPAELLSVYNVRLLVLEYDMIIIDAYLSVLIQRRTNLYVSYCLALSCSIVRR